MANYTIKWDETLPLGTGSKSLGDNYLRDNLTAVRERLDTEHTNVTGSTGDALLMHTWAVVAKTGDYTATAADHVILVTTAASTITITLPTAVGITGKPYKVKKVDSGAGTVVIDGNASETIDGATTLTLTNQYDFADLVSNGTNWQVVSKSAVSLDWDTVWTDAVHDHSTNAEGGTLTSPGHVIQVVNTQTGAVATGTTTIPLDDTIPAITEGTEFMTLAITPSSAANLLLIDVVLQGSLSNNLWLITALFQDATSAALAAMAQYTAYTNGGANVILRHKMTAGTTSETTFRVRAGPATSATLTFNGSEAGRLLGGVMASSITIMEIAV